MKYGFTLTGVGIALLISSGRITTAPALMQAGILTVVVGITWTFLAAKRQEALNMKQSFNSPDFPEKSAA
jgi:small-conductance mechanosensitive channel